MFGYVRQLQGFRATWASLRLKPPPPGDTAVPARCNADLILKMLSRIFLIIIINDAQFWFSSVCWILLGLMKITVSPFAVFIADTVELCIRGGGYQAKSEVQVVRKKVSFWEMGKHYPSQIWGPSGSWEVIGSWGGGGEPSATKQPNYVFARHLVSQDIPDLNSQKTGLWVLCKLMFKRTGIFLA